MKRRKWTMVRYCLIIAVLTVLTSQFRSLLTLQSLSTESLAEQLSSGHHAGSTESPSTFRIPASNMTDLPDWVQRYVEWHNIMRRRFPGETLFTDPQAPKLLIRTCTNKCGGLNDRLGHLPWDLYLANQTNRLYLINWCVPAPLESFLIPNKLDWRIPSIGPLAKMLNDTENCLRISYHLKEFFADYKSERPTDIFWRSHLDLAIKRAVTGDFRDDKMLAHRLLGSDVELIRRLRVAGETDTIIWNSSYGAIFWLFFQPHPAVKSKLDTLYQGLNLVPRNYSAVHCRVRHPKMPKAERLLPRVKVPGGADRGGLLWEGDSRDYAITVGTEALKCVENVLTHPREPVYFYSDSEDLVAYLTHQLKDPAYLGANNASIASRSAELAAFQVVVRLNVVGREIDGQETLHIDRQQGHSPREYDATFVDLFVATQSRCITAGVGNFALFAAKLSGTSCVRLHMTEEWGKDEYKEKRFDRCN